MAPSFCIFLSVPRFLCVEIRVIARGVRLAANAMYHVHVEMGA